MSDEHRKEALPSRKYIFTETTAWYGQLLSVAKLIDLIQEIDGEKVVIGISGSGNFAYKTIRRK